MELFLVNFETCYCWMPSALNPVRPVKTFLELWDFKANSWRNILSRNAIIQNSLNNRGRANKGLSTGSQKRPVSEWDLLRHIISYEQLWLMQHKGSAKQSNLRINSNKMCNPWVFMKAVSLQSQSTFSLFYYSIDFSILTGLLAVKFS